MSEHELTAIEIMTKIDRIFGMRLARRRRTGTHGDEMVSQLIALIALLRMAGEGVAPEIHVECSVRAEILIARLEDAKHARPAAAA